MQKQWAACDEIGVDYWAAVARDARRQHECLRATEERFAAELDRFLAETGTAWREFVRADGKDPRQG